MNATDGSLSPLNKFGFTTGTYNTDITVNNSNGSYVMDGVARPPAAPDRVLRGSI